MRRMMEDEGGFEHNIQGLRVVERLEERYPGTPGLSASVSRWSVSIRSIMRTYHEQ